MKNILMLLAILLLVSEAVYCQPSERDFKKMLNSSHNSNNIRLNGFYNNETDEQHAKVIGDEFYRKHSYIDSYHQSKDVATLPVYFFANGLVAKSALTETINQEEHLIRSQDKRIYEADGFPFFWGTYEVREDTIEALIFLVYKNRFFPRRQAKLTKYRGIIKNGDTITDWKVVQPYPKLFDGTDQLEIAPVTMVFKAFEVKKDIDSSKAWVNKYKQ